MPASTSIAPQRILVTGAAGFIASRVCAQLHAQGHQVTGLDNFNDAYDIRLKDWRWAQLEKIDGLDLHRLDLTDTVALKRLFETHSSAGNAAPFDAVINLAARAGVRASVENPSVYVEANVAGALNVLEMCRQFGIKKFVLASTSSLYGKEHPTPYREEMNTDRQLSPYAATKKAAEAMAYTYHFLHGLDVSVLRYFTVYGPAGRPDMTPLRFTQRIAEGRPITVFGDGSQSRDFTYVDDIARGTISALRSVGYDIFNLGSDEPLKLSSMITLIEELTGKKAKIDYRPWHPADMAATWADISKARAKLEWSPQTKFRDGLSKLVAWYEENRSWAKDIDTD
jgi:nucleoside-diphosphate-sugar epimerase